LRAGYMEDWRHHQTYSGTVQGGVISPLLTNIVLNELDQFVTNELVPQYTRGKKRQDNPEYRQLSSAMRKARRCHNLTNYRQLVAQRRSLPTSDPDDPGFRRLRYCRYADDFALGFIGPKQEAVEIKAKIELF